MSDIAVELRHVSKSFGSSGAAAEINAVSDINLAIGNGEFFTLLGPSGCGKTTTLRMIAGFEQPTEGELLIRGQNMNGMPAHLRPVNTVFQSYALFPHLNVADNVGFGLDVKGVARPERQNRVLEALKLVQMDHMIARKPSELSGGQQQRVALARALVNRPSVLLLDEPFGALDLKLRKEMQIELKQMQRRLGITFIFVTHDQEEALTMSDRIAVMHKGKVLQVDDPVGIYERPNHPVRRRFYRRNEFSESQGGRERPRHDRHDRDRLAFPGPSARRRGHLGAAAGSFSLRAFRERQGAAAAARRHAAGIDLYRHRPALPGPARFRRDRVRPHPEQRAHHPRPSFERRPLQPLLLHVGYPRFDRVNS